MEILTSRLMYRLGTMSRALSTNNREELPGVATPGDFDKVDDGDVH